MQAGWAWRRSLEHCAGRAALDGAASSGIASPGSFASAADDHERTLYVSHLAGRCDDEALDELAALVLDAPGEARWAARVALTRALQRRACERRQRPNTHAPQVDTTIPAAPAAMNPRVIGRDPVASSMNKYGR